MSRMSVFGMTVLIGLAISCGDDKPTEPAHELVGTWALYAVDTLPLGLLIGRTYVPGEFVIRFNADGTCNNNVGDPTSRWFTRGALLTFGGIDCGFFVDGDELTLTFDKAQLAQFGTVVDDDVASMRWFLRRR